MGVLLHCIMRHDLVLVYLNIINLSAVIYLKYMSVFAFNSYTEALNPVLQRKREEDSTWTLAKLAQECQMQPSYLTNVLKGRADFNSDQLYRIGDQLGLKTEEVDFLHLLLELKRTTFEKRKQQLNKQIQDIQKQQLRAEKHLTTKSVELSAEQLEQYYLNPYIQLVHIYLGTHDGTSSAESLAKKFLTTTDQMSSILKVLEEIKYIHKKGARYEVLVRGQHLPRESHILRPHHVMMRMKSLDQMQRLAPDQTYSFSATISTLPEVRTQLQAEFLKFLKVAEKLVRGHKPQNLYQINFDLFPWEIE